MGKIENNKLEEIGTSFLWTCKELYLKGLHPFDFEKQETEEYQKVIFLGKSIIKEKGLQEFLGYLMEGQYRVNIWAAFIGLEYGNPDSNEILKTSGKEKLFDFCLNEVKASEITKLSESIDRNKSNWIKQQEAKFNERN